MLVLSRLEKESIMIDVAGVKIFVKVSEVRGNKVRLAVDAPKDVIVHRSEIYERIRSFQAVPEPECVSA